MRGRLVAAFMAVSCALLLLGAPSDCTGGEAPTGVSWTFMVYMANDVSNPLPWENNINSMEAADLAEGIDIIALIDNPLDGDSVILKVEHDEGGLWNSAIVSTQIDDGGAVIPVSDEVDMADPATLTAFIGFAATEFPADRLILILWGHGADWRGLCPDKIDLLTLPELGGALEDAATDLGGNIDMVVVDACAQATVEMLAELGPYVSYFVGAQTNIPSQGLPYQEILTTVSESPSQSLEEFGSAIVSEYVEYSWYHSPYSATMATFDLSKLDTALDLLDMLSIQGVKYGQIFHDVINYALTSAEYYDTEWYVDLIDLLGIIHSSELPLELRNMALQAAVSFREATVAFQKYDHPDPYDDVSVARANGAIIYAPATSYFEAEYNALTLSTTTHWDEFGTLARLVMPTEQMVPGPSISYTDSDQDGLLDTAFLEWQDDHPMVEAWVYSQLPNGVVFMDRLTSASSNISIHGHIGNLFIAASAVDAEGNATSYTTVHAILYGSIRLEIVLAEDGERIGEGLDVRVVTSTYAGYAIPNGNVHSMDLIVPTQAGIGEMVVVSVMEGQDLLLTSSFVVGEHDSTVTIMVYDPEDGTEANDMVLWTFSLTPALLVGIFTALLYWDHRRTRKDS